MNHSDYRYLNCGEFEDILVADQYFRQLTLAPEDGDGICRLVVGYTEEVDTDVWKSFFRAVYLTLNPTANTLSFNPYGTDYIVVLQVLLPLPVYFPKPIQYMGVIARREIYDLVILTVGTLTPDDVLLVHELGSVTNPLRTSSGTYCGPLLDHPWYFAKIQITGPISTDTNIAIVRNNEGASGSSFVRYTAEPANSGLNNWKIVLGESDDIPAECRLFHMDSGDMNDDLHNDDDLVVIWKECEGCSEDYYVLKITSVSQGIRKNVRTLILNIHL